MKKTVMLAILTLSLMTARVFASGLIADSAMEGPLVDINTIGNFDDNFNYAERTGNYEKWIFQSKVAESGVNADSFRIDSSGSRGFGMILHDQGATTGSGWQLTADLYDQADRSAPGSTLTLKVFGMNDPWSSTPSKNLFSAQSWATPADAVLLGSIVVDPATIPTGTPGVFATYTAAVDFGAGYEYIAIAAAGAGAQRIDVDNFDIVSETLKKRGSVFVIH